MTFLQTTLLAASIWMPAQAATDAKVDYLRDVKPILASRCYACHGAIKQKAGLRLDTVAFMKEGGDHGMTLVPGKADDSLLLKHVVEIKGHKRMPPELDGEALEVIFVAGDPLLAGGALIR